MGKDAFKVIAVVAIIAVLAGLSSAYQYGTVEDVSFSVTGKDRVSYGSGDDLKHKYVIFTEYETFENTDALFWGKFNSSDIYGAVENGSYSATVYGWRIPFLSQYRNIIRMRKTKGEGK